MKLGLTEDKQIGYCIKCGKIPISNAREEMCMECQMEEAEFDKEQQRDIEDRI